MTKQIDNLAVTYKTDDYDIFKMQEGNRPIFKPHLTRLILSIEKKDLLPNNPIIVNDAMEVIDGQHRLFAAKALGKPIYYVIKKNADIEDTILLNANHRKWITDDYLNSYIKLGKKEYIRLKEFAKEYRISPPLAVIFLSNSFNSTHETMQKFRDGEFKIKDYDLAENMASLIGEIRNHCTDGCWHDRKLFRALLDVMEKTDPKILVSKLEKYNLLVSRRTTARFYLEELQDIINFGEKSIIVSLL